MLTTAHMALGASRFESMTWFQDNVPVMVGPVAAAPDGKGFEARFSNFSVRHLPDIRRVEWLEKDAKGK